VISPSHLDWRIQLQRLPRLLDLALTGKDETRQDQRLSARPAFSEPAIHQLVAALRAATPAIFKTLRDEILATGGGVGKKVDAERVVVANFVVMLDRLDQTFAQLVRAFEHPTNPVTLAALVAFSTQLEADVKSVRQAYVAFRNAT